MAGLAPGSSDRDYASVGVPFEERWERFDEAVRWQETAAGLAPPDQRPDYETRLELYRSGQPYRDAGPPDPAGE